jgi:hypothetical protein
MLIYILQKNGYLKENLNELVVFTNTGITSPCSRLIANKF